MEKETYWSKFASDFEERNNKMVGSDMSLIMEKVAQLCNLHNCLELGCGNGTYSRVLAKNATKILATDFSDEMVAETTKRLKSIKNIDVQKANCLELDFQDKQFDSVFMANLLHIIPHPEKAIQEVRRVLKNSGRLIIVSYTTDGMSFFYKLKMIFDYMKTYGKPSPYAYPLKLDMAKQMVESNGFEIEQAELVGKKMKAVFLIGKLK